MRVVAVIIACLIAAVVAASAAIDLFGTGSPWIGIGAAASAAALLAPRPVAAALCAGCAIATIEVLVLWRGVDNDLVQAALHLGVAAFLAAAFSLTRLRTAATSATSPGPEKGSNPAIDGD
jgi:hypothetical protein